MLFSSINLSLIWHSVLTQRKVCIEWLAHNRETLTNRERYNMDYYIEIGGSALEVRTLADDLSQAFTATCLETGEILRINGWLIDSIELI